MRTLVLGMDGYIGWALTMHLAKRGHIVSEIDNFARRANVMGKIGTRYDGMAEAFTIERMLVPRNTISQDNFGAVPYEY